MCFKGLGCKILSKMPLKDDSIGRSNLVYLFQEFLEFKPFKYILPKGIYYFRYIDDIFIIYPNKYAYIYIYIYIYI